MDIKLPEGTKVPDHVAIIMDGNRRWARSKGLDTLEGHKAGFDRAISIGRAARKMGIHTVSLWGFSTENWDREKRELDYLMMLYKRMLKQYLKEAMEEEVRLIHLGRKDRLPKDLIEQIADAEAKTKHFYKHIVNICLDHGGRDDILRAIDKIYEIRDKKYDSRQITEKEFEKYLDTSDQPYPHVDLLIRTSGEQRTSGFLLWQAAYAEMYWELDHLPDFSPEKFTKAIIDYSRRRRRFGANDKEEHLKFDPKLVASFEVGFRKELEAGESPRFRDLVINYVKEQYGMSKELAKTAGISLANALVFHKKGEMVKAKKALVELYLLVKKNLGLTMEPEFVANMELKLWNGKPDMDTELKMRELLSEAWRFSDFQATKAAHLATLARAEMDSGKWDKANWYLERSYVALKERVA